MTTPPTSNLDPDPGDGTRQGTWLRAFRSIARVIDRAERALVTLLLLALIALPAASALAQRFTGRQVLEAQPLARNITLWIGFAGAVLVTLTGQHLSLSTLEMIRPGWRRQAAGFFTHAVSAAACALLTWASVQFVDSQWGNLGLVAYGIRVAWSELVMPVGFALMTLRFAWRADAGGPPRLTLRAAALGVAAAIFALAKVSPGPVVVTLLLALVLAAFLLGAPVFVVMAGVTMVLFFQDGTPLGSVPNAIYGLSTHAALPAIPLLTAAGYVLAEGGAAKRLVRAYKGLFGWMPGGVAIMATVVCALFTTFTGASGVTILALGGLLLPALREDKYPEDFSVGVVTGAGSLGLLFPPSLPVILYAVIAEAPVFHLFIAGFLPGVLMIVLVAIYGMVVARRAGAPRQRFDGGEALSGLWEAKWDLGLPSLVVIVMALGWATPVEAAALGAAYSIFVELVVYRSIHPFRDLPRVLVHAAGLVGSVLILMGSAYALNEWFILEEIPTRLVEWMTVHVPSPALFLLLLNAVLLVVGSVLEMYSAIVVIAPLVAALGEHYGIDPIHLGVVFLANLELGFLFPPMGLNLFLSASRFGKPLPWVYRKTFPFLLIMSAGVLAITYFPAITTGFMHWVIRVLGLAPS